ncbi:uncharacterized protein SAPINGB_P002371 [Magnusiomyces paraingens]|uniref:Uncharacterized protein n=1 Tax=Magnusiomyces paraingens TaxID=2606893 RepID=A0A5E8BDI4_9ASCO|nr:uncharacterized protein SAPINGB_P002371 [Saprochaete ingens]VVT49643.1 unnamed protein product [Saprochaete ingens]
MSAPLPYPTCYARALRKQAISFLKNKNAQRHASLASFLPAYLLPSSTQSPVLAVDISIPFEIDLRTGSLYASSSSSSSPSSTKHYAQSKKQKEQKEQKEQKVLQLDLVIPIKPTRPEHSTTNDQTYLRIIEKQVATELLAHIHTVVPEQRAAYLLYDILRIDPQAGHVSLENSGGNIPTHTKVFVNNNTSAYSDLKVQVWDVCIKFFKENKYQRSIDAVERAAREKHMTQEQVVEIIASAEEMMNIETTDGRVPFAELVEWSCEEARVELGELLYGVVSAFVERVGGM